jgi:hypothetical protein
MADGCDGGNTISGVVPHSKAGGAMAFQRTPSADSIIPVER